nr:unnamed protein product [Callosobruchus analis]
MIMLLKEITGFINMIKRHSINCWKVNYHKL